MIKCESERKRGKCVFERGEKLGGFFGVRERPEKRSGSDKRWLRIFPGLIL